MQRGNEEEKELSGAVGFTGVWCVFLLLLTYFTCFFIFFLAFSMVFLRVFQVFPAFPMVLVGWSRGMTDGWLFKILLEQCWIDVGKVGIFESDELEDMRLTNARSIGFCSRCSLNHRCPLAINKLTLNKAKGFPKSKNKLTPNKANVFRPQNHIFWF